MNENKRIDIEGCARCDGGHFELKMKPFTKPVLVEESSPVEFTHWATCPTTGEPILIQVSSTIAEPEDDCPMPNLIAGISTP